MMCPICGVGLGQVAQSLGSFYHPKDDICLLGGLSASKEKWEYTQTRLRERVRQMQCETVRRIIETIEDEFEV